MPEQPKPTGFIRMGKTLDYYYLVITPGMNEEEFFKFPHEQAKAVAVLRHKQLSVLKFQVATFGSWVEDYSDRDFESFVEDAAANLKNHKLEAGIQPIEAGDSFMTIDGIPIIQEDM